MKKQTLTDISKMEKTQKKDNIMKANELRVGSYVSHPRNDSAIVESIQKSAQGSYCLTFLDEHSGYWIEKEGKLLCKPIKLTEDWLLKFGFKYSCFKTLGLEKNGLRIIIKSTNDRSGRVFFDDCIIQETQTKHVHELQNLYLALTERELTI